MNAMTHEQASFWLGTYMNTLKNESRITRRVLEAVPHDRLDYKPDPFAKTASELAWHIAGADNRFVEAVTQGRFDTAWAVPETVKTPAELADWYGTRYAQNLTALASASPDHASEDRRLPRPVPVAGARVPAVWFASHDSSSRPAVRARLRSMGGKVPAMFRGELRQRRGQEGRNGVAGPIRDVMISRRWKGTVKHGLADPGHRPPDGRDAAAIDQGSTGSVSASILRRD